MGLYSTNKLNNISNVDESFDDIMRELDEAVEDTRLGDLLEFTIEMHEQDQRMFNSLLEADFISIANESYLTEDENKEVSDQGNEMKKEKITEKVMALFTKAIEAIKSAFATIMKKIESVISTDKAIIKRYGKLDKNNLAGFEGIKNFEFPVKVLKGSRYINDADDANKEFDKTLNEIRKASDIDRVNEIFNNMKLYFEELKKVEGATNDEYFKKFDNWIPDDKAISFLNDYANGALTKKKDLKEFAAKTIANYKNKGKEADKASKEANNAGNEVKAIKMERISSLCSMYISFANTTFKEIVGVSVKEIKCLRSAYIICGKYAAKKASKKVDDVKPETANTEENKEQTPKTESALLNWAIIESSNEYIDNVFAY